MCKQLFFSSNVTAPHSKEELLIYEPFWQMGIVTNEEERMKRLERLLGVQHLEMERLKILKQQRQQREAIQTALIKGSVVAWVGPSAAEELAFLEIAEQFDQTENLYVRIVPGPLHIHERAPELFQELEQQLALKKEEWMELIPAFSSIEKHKLIERESLFAYKERDEHFFDAEVLEALRQFEEPIPVEKLVAAVYAKRPDYPVPFYFQRVNENKRKGHIVQTDQNLSLSEHLQ
ncbi:hypothetical protein ABC345_06335 [Shouchella sp. 1P09AA]|uniref:hypothetical protein n=1 Tax=unclassified Shouchella TaxID=2893065 RepID=UPI00399F1B32